VGIKKEGRAFSNNYIFLLTVILGNSENEHNTISHITPFHLLTAHSRVANNTISAKIYLLSIQY
jgi:hypothetical protein